MPEQNEWTVPEAQSIEVLFRYSNAEGKRVTKGFLIPAHIARALNQFCVDNGRVDADGVPDALGLFAEHSYGKINADGSKAQVGGVTMLNTYDAGGSYTGTPFRFEAAKIGFFGVAAVARQTATADAASILALLQAYGLSN